MDVIKKPIGDLVGYDKNARMHSEHQIEEIANSIKNFGFNDPIEIGEDNIIISGHARLEAAKKLGLDEVPVIVHKHMNEKNRKAYVLAANRIAMSSTWDDQLLKEEMVDLNNADFDLSLTGFTEDEISDILNIDEIEENLNDPDAVPGVPDEPIAKLGDVWLLGSHRLMCGDSTSIDAVDRLMDGAKADMVFTDPPYGVSANGGRSSTKTNLAISDIINDDLRGDELYQFLIDSLSSMPLSENASFYVCYDQKTQHEFTKAIKSIGWRQRSTIIWNKNVFGLSGFKGYRPKFELIAFGHVGDDYNWHGDNAQADVWDIPRPKERHGNHPTPKPVELIEKALINSSAKDQTVLDLFGGSGSTLIACEKLKRKCYMMELDPVYVQVILERYKKYTGRDPVHENGKSYSEMIGH